MRALWIPLVLALAPLTGGCTTEEAKVNPEDNPYLSQGRIQFESSLAKHTVEIVRVDSERVGSGLLRITLTVRNKTKKNLWSEFRTTYLDERRHVLEQTNWEPIELNARTVSEYTCTSMSSRAADYQVIIRKPDKTSFDKP